MNTPTEILSRARVVLWNLRLSGAVVNGKAATACTAGRHDARGEWFVGLVQSQLGQGVGLEEAITNALRAEAIARFRGRQ